MEVDEELENVSFGALLKANNALYEENEHSDENNHSDSEDSNVGYDNKKNNNNDNNDNNAKNSKNNKKNKRAPMEMSSKKEVSRKRIVVSGVGSHAGSGQRIDPRFDSVVEHSVGRREDYGFITKLREQEVKDMKMELKKLEKRNKNNKNNLENIRTIEKMKKEIQRAKSKINDSKEKEFAEKVIAKHEREEKSKIASGIKKPYYLKRSAAKELVLKEKFKQMSSSQVNRTIAKRRKKAASKERKKFD